MSIKQLQVDIEDHFQLFERVPLRTAWRRRDARAAMIWTVTSFVGLLTALIQLPPDVLSHLGLMLVPILIVSLICALHTSEVYSLIRAQRLGAGPAASLSDRLHLRQDWLCERYQCSPAELADKARHLRDIWEERQSIQKLASNDNIGPRFSTFLGLPDSARFIGLLLAVAAIFATLVTLGGSIDSFFDVLENWKLITRDILLGGFLLAELVMFWIIITGMIREVGKSLLEQFNMLPTGTRRVYRYLLAMHNASEPTMPFSRKLPVLFKLIAMFFEPIPSVWAKLIVRVSKTPHTPS